MSLDPHLCDQCKATGLAILPVRYAVVTHKIHLGLPAWASGDRVKSVEIDPEFKYALRTLRTGFIYLFYAKNARGPNQWECYSICEDGSLIASPSTHAASPYPFPSILCSTPAHVAGAAQHCIVINQPEKCGPTWIAYSQTKWSDATVQSYQTDAGKRNARMQTIYPAAMFAGSKHSHGQIASQEALEQVLEYAPSTNTTDLPHDQDSGDISEGENGAFRADRLQLMSTLYPWHMRSGQAKSTTNHLRERSKSIHGKSGTPHVLALWDAVGITHELNGFRNDAAGWIAKFGRERELQASAVKCIETIKPGLEAQAYTYLAKTHVRPPEPSPAEIRLRMIAHWNPADQAVAAALEKEKATRAKKTQEHEENLKKFSANHVASAWPKYQMLLDMGAVSTFKANFDDLFARAESIIERRTTSLVSWLEAGLLVDSFEDFSQKNLADGVLFGEVVANAIRGMGSGLAGQRKIAEWVSRAKASDRNNLLWRMFALNYSDAIVEVDAALRHIYAEPRHFSKSEWNSVVNDINWDKLVDLYSKALALHNARSGEQVGGGIRAIPGYETGLMTVGGALFRPFAKVADSINEGLLFMLLTAGAGVHQATARSVVVWTLWKGRESREEFIRRLSFHQDYQFPAISEEAAARINAQRAAWSNMRDSADTPDPKTKAFNVVRDARLALVIGMFEAFNLSKAYNEAKLSPGNERAQIKLVAGIFSTTTVFVDLLGSFAEAITTDRSIRFQLLKILGASLSVVASGYVAYLDFTEADDLRKSARYDLASMYLIRGVFQVVGGVLSALTAFSYCSPLIETFGTKYGQRLLAESIRKTALRFIFSRVALAAASIQVTLVLLGVSVAIWAFEDDALETWCKRCAFRAVMRLEHKPFADAQTQIDSFNKSIAEIS